MHTRNEKLIIVGALTATQKSSRLVAAISVLGVAYMDVGKGRKQER